MDSNTAHKYRNCTTYLYTYLFTRFYKCIQEPGKLSRYSDRIRARRSDERSSIPGGDWEFFSSTPWPHRLWGPPSPYLMGIRRSRGVKLNTHLRLVPRSRIHEAITPLPQYAFMVWFLVKKRHRDNFTIFTVVFKNRETSVSTVTRLRAGRPEFYTRKIQRFISSLPRPQRLSDSPSLIFGE
jgi:hypothetical protein